MKYQIIKIKNNQWIGVQVYDKDDKPILYKEFEITPELTEENLVARIQKEVAKKNNLDNFKLKMINKVKVDLI